MGWIAITIALMQAPAPQGPAILQSRPWRLVDRTNLHVGVRPAADVTSSDWAVGVTVQVTTSL